MKIYKQGGFTVFSPKEIKLNRSEKGFITKMKNGQFHMDIFDKKGPTGSSVEFGGSLFRSVLELFK